MATKTTKVLKTNFTCDNGKSLTLSLDSYKGDLTDSEIQSGVEAMLASGALASSGAVFSADEEEKMRQKNPAKAGFFNG